MAALIFQRAQRAATWKGVRRMRRTGWPGMDTRACAEQGLSSAIARSAIP